MVSSAVPKMPSVASCQVSAPLSSSKSVHFTLASCCGVLLAFSLIGAPRGASTSGIHLAEAVLLLVPALLIAPASFHQRRDWERRDAILMLPWTLVLAALVAQAAPTAVAHGAPLRDSLWRDIDSYLEINVPAIMAFTLRHPLLDSILTFNYYWMLYPMLLAAILLPSCLGKRVAAQQFVLVNALAFVLALPCMVMLPAIGPWVAWHFSPNVVQVATQKTIESLHERVMTGADTFGGIICFPSFHVFWAVVSAHALQPFRILRYPAIIVAVLITISTVTTGWHYGVDVLGGLLLALICTLLVNAFMRTNKLNEECGTQQ